MHGPHPQSAHWTVCTAWCNIQCNLHCTHCTMQSGKCLLAQWEAYIGPGWHALTYIGPVGILHWSRHFLTSSLVPPSLILPHSPLFSLQSLQLKKLGLGLTLLVFQPIISTQIWCRRPTSQEEMGNWLELTSVDLSSLELIQLDLPFQVRNGWAITLSWLWFMRVDLPFPSISLWNQLLHGPDVDLQHYSIGRGWGIAPLMP